MLLGKGLYPPVEGPLIFFTIIGKDHIKREKTISNSRKDHIRREKTTGILYCHREKPDHYGKDQIGGKDYMYFLNNWEKPDHKRERLLLYLQLIEKDQIIRGKTK